MARRRKKKRNILFPIDTPWLSYRLSYRFGTVYDGAAISGASGAR